MLRNFLIIVASVLFSLLFVFALLVVLPRAVLHHEEEMLDRMAKWRDQAVASPHSQEAVNDLLGELHSSDEIERGNAAAYLGQVGARAPDLAGSVVPALIHTLQTDAPSEAKPAAEALGEIGPAAVEAVPALLAAATKYPDSSPGFESVLALGEIANPGDPTVGGVLQKAALGGSQLMRSDAKSAIDTLQSRRQAASTHMSAQ
jgi:hypothetical protein